MKILTPILLAALTLELAVPATTFAQAWETDDYGFPIENDIPSTRTWRTQRQVVCVEPPGVVVQRPAYQFIPVPRQNNVKASNDSGTAYRSFSYQPTAVESPQIQSTRIDSGRLVVPYYTPAAVGARRSAARKPTYLRPGAKARGDFGHGGR